MSKRLNVNLKPPSSLSVAYEINALYWNEHHQRAGIAAALGVCWSGQKRPARATNPLLGVAVYGHAVIDDLLARGWAYQEIMEGGTEAIKLVIDALPHEQRVEELEGNSEGQGDSTS